MVFLFALCAFLLCATFLTAVFFTACFFTAVFFVVELAVAAGFATGFAGAAGVWAAIADPIIRTDPKIKLVRVFISSIPFQSRDSLALTFFDVACH